MKRILVVDDQEDVRMVYTLLFAAEDLEVLEAEDGVQALNTLQSQPVDLVLSDCMMPNMSGVELMREAKKTHPKTPFIFVSAHVKDEDLEGLQPVAIFPKPFHLGDLKDTVHRVLKDD